uniref:Histidine kinase/HSP90-like ATPase domain-containing protein n=1 Tax=Corethron hystrix TaxID=216773 RepID=A0A7S1FW46_9STRA|mmetsp:Transcript_34026/g.78520  ORF Transcript_34026/g.78520 Transcript_34026/m.78520 type:complete len:833 (+) Transcript_34026:115-2613(+)
MRFSNFPLALALVVSLAILPSEHENGLVAAKPLAEDDFDESGAPIPKDSDGNPISIEEEVNFDIDDEDENFDLDPYDIAPDHADDEDDVVMPKMGADKTDHSFDADVGRVMDIVVNSLYQHKDVFLRELISNASDALDKIRFKSLTDKSALGDTEELEIKVYFDKEAGTITIRDTGVGMTRREMIDNLGTVAKSGTKSFVNAATGESSGDLANQIGQFGVGFYSVFLVAQKVQVASKSNNEENQHVWQSDASGNFQTSIDPRNNTLGRGTEITLFLKSADKDDFLSEYALERIIKRYSEFITFPILLEKSKEETIEMPEDVSLDDEDVDAEESDEDEASKTKTETITVKEFERVNHEKAIWARDKDSITDDAYTQFYHTLSKGQNEAYRWIHFDAEGSINFKSILFLPSKISPEMRQPTYDVEEAGLKLYVRNVLISDKFNELLPRWMNFIKGVVDSDDLALNVNRETLQGSRIITSIGKKCEKKSIELMRKLSTEEKPDDADDTWVHPYEQFWENFGAHIKMGLHEDYQSQKKLLKLLRFKSTKSGSKWISLKEYVERMSEWQEKIYYITGLSSEEVENSPFLEKATKKGVEVLFMTDPVDEWLMQSLTDFEDKKFTIVTKEGLKFNDDDEDEMDRRASVYKKMYKKLLSYLKKIYGKKVAKVVISAVLEDSPAAFSTAMYGESATMARIKRASAFQEGKQVVEAKASSKVLELNARHPFIIKFQEIIEANEDGSNDDLAKDTAWALYDSCGLQSGYDIDDVEDYGQRMTRIMQRVLKVDNLELEEEANPVEDDSDDDDEGAGAEDEEFEIPDFDFPEPDVDTPEYTMDEL